MLAKHSSGSENEFIRRHDVASDDSSIADKNSTPARRLALADEKPLPTVMVTAADCQKNGFWSSVFDYLIEGFALYGASLHPTVFLPVELHPDERRVPTPREISLRKWRTPKYLISPATSQGMASPGFDHNPDQTTPAGSALASADQSLRERQIQKAVAAMVKLDDLTLRNLGIPHRSYIEQTVRYCHDC